MDFSFHILHVHENLLARLLLRKFEIDFLGSVYTDVNNFLILISNLSLISNNSVAITEIWVAVWVSIQVFHFLKHTCECMWLLKMAPTYTLQVTTEDFFIFQHQNLNPFKMRVVEVFFYPLLPDFRKIIDFWKIPRLCALWRSGKSNM
jgi:hypothetical protein